ncbi:MAG: hypothetical protein DMF69_23070, partial [Acidobacteria bacterium]
YQLLVITRLHPRNLDNDLFFGLTVGDSQVWLLRAGLSATINDVDLRIEFYVKSSLDELIGNFKS